MIKEFESFLETIKKGSSSRRKGVFEETGEKLNQEDRILINSIRQNLQVISLLCEIKKYMPATTALIMERLKKICLSIRTHSKYRNCVGFQITENEVATAAGLLSIDNLDSLTYLSLEEIKILLSRQ